MWGPPALRSQHSVGGSPGPGISGDGGFGNFQLGEGSGSAIGDTLSSLIPNVSDFPPNSQSGKGDSYTTN